MYINILKNKMVVNELSENFYNSVNSNKIIIFLIFKKLYLISE
ncbi:hypothetical protein RV11_GL001480 [Enterococcus phoeniculicola]|nr:hypothetical protein RV11_GL001480 [Enterococcus phoeniculicola]